VFVSLERNDASEWVNGCGLDGRLRADDGSHPSRWGDAADLPRQWHLLRWSDGVGHRIVRRARGDGCWCHCAWSNGSAVAAGRATGVAAGVTSVASVVREEAVPATAAITGSGATTASGGGGRRAYGGGSGLAALSGSRLANRFADRRGAGSRSGARGRARSGGTASFTSAATMMRSAAQPREESTAPAFATGITCGGTTSVTTGRSSRNNSRSRV